ASIIGSSFSSLKSTAVFSRGNSTRMRPGLASIRHPIRFPITPSVQPIWLDLPQTMRSTFGSAAASTLSFRYGVTFHVNRPGIAEPSGSSRLRSAHADGRIAAGGIHCSRTRRIIARSVGFVVIARELYQRRADFFREQLADRVRLVHRGD